LCGGLALVVFVIFSWQIFGGSEIIAETPIILAKTPDGARALELPPGSRVVVRRCVDTKDYIVPVILNDGVEFFLIGGNFHFLNNRRPWGC
jgi:hypothetical protein